MKKQRNQSKYLFKILWSKTYIGIAINEIYKENYNIPLTTFYFWPREEGWKLLKAELDSKPWIANQSKIEILNGYTNILHFWLKNVDKNINIIKPNTKSLNLNVDILALNSIS
jgi:30S ribosomal protein 3